MCVCVCVRTITFELNDLKAEASTEETPTQSGHMHASTGTLYARYLLTLLTHYRVANFLLFVANIKCFLATMLQLMSEFVFFIYLLYSFPKLKSATRHICGCVQVDVRAVAVLA